MTSDGGGKWIQFFTGLAEHLRVVDVFRPTDPLPTRAVAVLSNWRLNLRERSLDPSWSVAMFDARTRQVDADLASRPRGDHQVIVQAQTLFAPGRDARKQPYVIYTDSTHALNRRFRFGGDPTPGRRGEKLCDRERQVVQGAAHVFTMSEFARGSMVDDYGCSPESVTAIGAGVNLTVKIGEEERSPSRAIFVGFDFERKGGLDVLAAWPAVRAAIPDAELLIVGPPRRQSGDGVKWAGSVTSPEELSRLYGSAAVFVLPTRWDPWGLVYHEAMSHGLPCIGTDAFAVPEIIDAGKTGLLVKPQSPDAIAQAMIELLSDPVRTARMGEEAARRAQDAATWGNVAAKMVPAIVQLAER